jgi:glycosyltransferase involved in cell wall biosynthesis
VKISVVIPTYNRTDLLPLTLNSIFQQTMPPHEIIVVDDESTDDTEQLLKGLAAKVKTIRIKNSGEVIARNVGVMASTGDLIAFCDNDDLWKPNYLDGIAQLWTQHPGLTASYSNFQILRENQIEEKTKFDHAPRNVWPEFEGARDKTAILKSPIIEQLLKFQPFFPSAMVVNRQKFISLGGWDEGAGRGAGSDLATTLLMGANPPIGICCTPFVVIRKHPGNASGDTEKMNLADASVLEYVLKTRPELAPLKDTFRASIDRRRVDALNAAFSRRDFKAVREIDQLISSRRTKKHLVKRAIASLPNPVAIAIADAVGQATARNRN